MRLQLTLAILKPDVVANPRVLYAIRRRILDEGLKVVRTKRFRMSRNQAEDFYAEHEGKFFHGRLVTFMSSGESDVHILAATDAIKRWRKLMGPTKVFKTRFEDPDSIRGRFGLTDTRNATHGSDSEESARKEIQFFFRDFDVDAFYADEARYFEDDGKLRFDKNKFTHFVSKF